MDLGNFYFLKDEYFDRFQDEKLMRNIEMVDGKPHDRPCYFAFYDEQTEIYWMIPFSSEVAKYQKEYNRKVAKSKDGNCDTILFGEILGYIKAFLIQNMCPVKPIYINNQYFDKDKHPVKVSLDFKSQLIKSAKKILVLERIERSKNSNYHYIFPDVINIEKALIKENGNTQEPS